ncbi:MAG: hypothetical protein Q9182_005495 [Xanthomendoza sp. 2 TL-2023]
MGECSRDEITVQPFRLLDLGPDIRTVLFSHLLPSVAIIYPVAEADPWPKYSFSRHKDNDDDWYDGYVPQILRVNHQLYEEGIAYLYARKTFVIRIYNSGFDFLKASTQLDNLPNLPYHIMKEFIILVPPHILPTQGADLRYNLLWLCGLLQSHGVHFRRLRINFTNQDSGKWEPRPPVTQSRDWLDANDDLSPPRMIPLWEYTDDEPENIPPDFVDRRHDCLNFEYTAWQQGYTSTWAWLASPLIMMHGVADECVIEPPYSYRGNPHYEGVKVWYERYLEGRIEEIDQKDQDVQDCWWSFRHPDGAKEDCEEGCEECVEQKEWMKMVRGFGRRWEERARARSSRETSDHERTLVEGWEG